MSPPTVGIFGAGIAGLTCAHELLERGFDVTLYERDSIGGKAATQYASLASGTYPLEHGFRLYPAFYKHVIDTMKRIPTFGTHTVADNLIATQVAGVARRGAPIQVIQRAGANTLSGLLTLAQQSFSAFTGDELPWQDAYRFQTKMLQYVTSCDDRRVKEYEGKTWWDFIDGDRYFSTAFQAQIRAFVKTMVAMDAVQGSANTVGKIATQLLSDVTSDGSTTDRVMNGPTTDKWLEPWFAYLSSHFPSTFHFKYPWACTALKWSPLYDSIVGAEVTNVSTHIPLPVTFDYYVCAMPMGPLQQLLAPVAGNLTDAQLTKVCLMNLEAHTDWCAGIQYIIKNDVPMVRGHMYYPDSAWALSSVSQAQFWDPVAFKASYGNGVANGILSVDICNWEAPGRFAASGQMGIQCSFGSMIAAEVWDQMNDALFDGTSSPLAVPGERIDFHLDDNILLTGPPSPFNMPGVQIGVEPAFNLTAHFIHPPNSYAQRPTVDSTVANLFLANDYVQTTTDLASMEGANEAGRRACNAILHASGSAATPAQLWPLVEPSFLDPFKQLDQRLLALGDPHALEIVGAENLAGLFPPIGDLLGVLASIIP